MLFKIHSVFILPKFLFLPAYQALSSCVNYTITTASTPYFSTPQVTSTIELTIAPQASFKTTTTSSIEQDAVILLHPPTPLLLLIEAYLEPINHPRMAAHDIPAYPDFNCMDMIVKDDFNRFQPVNGFAILFVHQYLSDQ
jgi:hypothetical protein